MKTDLEIQKDVMEELQWQPFLNASDIGVTVKNGIVTLSGRVDNYLKKVTAEKAARRVAGVKAVAEEIEVKPEGSFVKDDADIATAVLDALKWHSAVDEDDIKVKVENGVVTLEGDADWEFQRSAAIKQISRLVGVKAIVNKIRLRNSAPAKELKEKIIQAFKRNATIDSEKIKIETDGDTVTLHGKVRSWAEKVDAENAVWAARGVTKVNNLLEVETGLIMA